MTNKHSQAAVTADQSYVIISAKGAVGWWKERKHGTSINQREPSCYNSAQESYGTRDPRRFLSSESVNGVTRVQCAEDKLHHASEG